MIAAETIVFAFGSGVPRLWYASGIIASAAVICLLVVSVWLLKGPLRGFVDRELERQVNDRFSFASQTIFETWRIARQIDNTYAAIGLEARTDALDDSRRALLAHIRLGRDAALAEVIGLKNKAEHDCRRLEDLAQALTSALTVLGQVKSDLRQADEVHETVEQIEHRIRSRQLAEALEDARWPDAHNLLESIGFDLRRVLDFGRFAAMPKTEQDAYRILNVGSETPLENIRAVVNAYRRVWHPDLARDDVERQLCKPRMQQINVAWDIIQKARAQ